MFVEVKRIAQSAPFFVTFFELKKSKEPYLSIFFPQKYRSVGSKNLGAGFCNRHSTFENRPKQCISTYFDWLSTSTLHKCLSTGRSMSFSKDTKPAMRYS